VNTIPSHDVVLRRVVDRMTEGDQGQTADALAARLRPLYPKIAVFERQLSGERAQFYVYRDGRYEPERRDPWWEQPGVPRVLVATTTGQLTSVSGEWAALMHAEPAELVGQHFVDFVLPEARDAALAMFEAVRQFREVRSEALVRRPDGTTLPIEFRATRRDEEIEVSYRALE
jgi:PAS domain S-box-containing protein